MSYIPAANLATGDGGGGTGIEGTLIWAWNRTDLTQFDAPTVPDVNEGGGSPELSLGSITGRGNTINYTPNGGTTVTQVFLVTMPIPWPDERRDLLIDVEYADKTGGGGGHYLGIFAMGDDSGDHGLIHLGGGIGAEWQRLRNNGTTELDGGTGGGTINGALHRFHFRGDKPAGAAPRITSWQDLHDGNQPGNFGRARRTGATAAARGGINPFGNGASSLGSTWNNLDLDRFGLAFASSGGNPAPPNADILDFRVYLIDP